jgi:hypothetical protein
MNFADFVRQTIAKACFIYVSYYSLCGFFGWILTDVKTIS